MRIRFFIALFIVGCTHSIKAQQVTDEELTSYHDDVRQMVGFFEYMLNTLGSRKTPARDKDVIVTQSYEKIFRDSKVQIEDDLDENRDVITNKDVSAYLKDVDFFFKDVRFEFEIEEITHETNDNGNLFFKVAMVRNLKGLTVNNDSVNNTIPRYIEINYNPEKQDLQIASIYTNEFNEKKALKSWWLSISYEWRTIFKQKYALSGDSLSIDQIKMVVDTDSLDIADNKYIISIDALANLTDLKSLSINNTNIKDVAALRNLTDLEFLNLSNTQVSDISTLKYCRALKQLNLKSTPVKSIEVVQNMNRLEALNVHNTKITSLKPIENLKNLKTLNAQHTSITDLKPISTLSNLTTLNLSKTTVFELTPLAGLKALKKLNLDSTNIIDIKPLSQLTALETLSINGTSVETLDALSELKSLSNLYCDNTPLLLSSDVNKFAKNHPNVLVVYASEDNQSWWVSLDDNWRAVFKKALNISKEPSKEILAKITSIDSLNISEKRSISSLEPVKKLKDLRWLNAKSTRVTDISALKDLKQLKYLNISYTDIESLKPLKNHDKLEILEADSTQIVDLTPLFFSKSLKTLYVDNTPISGHDTNNLIGKNPEILVIFQTDRLIRWWLDLSSEWKDIFKESIKEDVVPTTKQLHRITQMESFEFSGSVGTLNPLDEFIRLKELKFNNTAVSDLSPLMNHANLTSLTASNSPVSNLQPLAQLKQLKKLNIANTPVESLDALKNLTDLRIVDCSGTQIKRLSDLELLHGLEKLNCSNTRVKRLDPVQYLSLKEITCYNTRISERRIEDFKEENPECKVTYY